VTYCILLTTHPSAIRNINPVMQSEVTFNDHIDIFTFSDKHLSGETDKAKFCSARLRHVPTSYYVYCGYLHCIAYTHCIVSHTRTIGNNDCLLYHKFLYFKKDGFLNTKKNQTMDEWAKGDKRHMGGT